MQGSGVGGMIMSGVFFSLLASQVALGVMKFRHTYAPCAWAPPRRGAVQCGVVLAVCRSTRIKVVAFVVVLFLTVEQYLDAVEQRGGCATRADGVELRRERLHLRVEPLRHLGKVDLADTRATTLTALVGRGGGERGTWSASLAKGARGSASIVHGRGPGTIPHGTGPSARPAASTGAALPLPLPLLPPPPRLPLAWATGLAARPRCGAQATEAPARECASSRARGRATAADDDHVESAAHGALLAASRARKQFMATAVHMVVTSLVQGGRVGSCPSWLQTLSETAALCWPG